MVVSAGVKSILDIGLTLEYLETMGVCVATLGAEGTRFPAFYTPDSGFASPCTVDTSQSAARLLMSAGQLGLESGILLAVPIPADSQGDNEVIESAVQQAVAEADALEMAGKEITPYILSRLNELTGGESLRANLALVEHNARIGAEVAVSYAKLANCSTSSGTINGLSSTSGTDLPPVKSDRRPLVVGGCIFDFVVRVEEEAIVLNGSTHQGCLYFFKHSGHFFLSPTEYIPTLCICTSDMTNRSLSANRYLLGCGASICATFSITLLAP